MWVIIGVCGFFLFFSIGVFIFGWNDRDDEGRLSLPAQVMVVFSIALLVSILFSLWELRLKWLYIMNKTVTKPFINFILSTPEVIFKCFIITILVLYLTWICKKVFDKWILAIIFPIPFCFFVNYLSVGILEIGCLLTWKLLESKKIKELRPPGC
jgi:hypothetical protein